MNFFAVDTLRVTAARLLRCGQQQGREAKEVKVNTELRNQSTSQLRELARGNGPVAQCAARLLAEREAASERLAQVCREVARERNGVAL